MVDCGGELRSLCIFYFASKGVLVFIVIFADASEVRLLPTQMVETWLKWEVTHKMIKFNICEDGSKWCGMGQEAMFWENF